MNYGFDKPKPPAVPAAETMTPRKLDLGNIGVAAVPEPSPAQEARAIEAGNSLGFVDRGTGPAPAVQQTPSVQSEGIVRVRAAREPQKNLFIKGPQRVVDRFIKYANESGSAAYWEAIEKLLDEHQAAH